MAEPPLHSSMQAFYITLVFCFHLLSLDTYIFSESLFSGMTDMTNHESSDDTLPSLLTVEETARYLRVHTKTVYSLIKSGALPSSCVGRQHRIRKEDIEEYLRRQETRGVAKNGGKTPR